MMHQAAPSSTVVVLEDANTGAPFRELDHSRGGVLGLTSRVRVVMAFDTEYRVRFKFPGDFARRRLELSIDGTIVARDLIVTSGAVLERFLDSAKRFKFVKATSEGVADPTSPNNGLITVRLWREKEGYRYSALRGMMAVPPVYVASDWGGAHVFNTSMGAGKGIAGEVQTAGQIHLNASYEAGATVEGRASDQNFGTTRWEGDADALPQVFEFQLVGQAAPNVAVHGYCTRCGAYHQTLDARFCASCGARR